MALREETVKGLGNEFATLQFPAQRRRSLSDDGALARGSSCQALVGLKLRGSSGRTRRPDEQKCLELRKQLLKKNVKRKNNDSNYVYNKNMSNSFKFESHYHLLTRVIFIRIPISYQL